MNLTYQAESSKQLITPVRCVHRIVSLFFAYFLILTFSVLCVLNWADFVDNFQFIFLNFLMY